MKKNIGSFKEKLKGIDSKFSRKKIIAFAGAIILCAGMVVYTSINFKSYVDTQNQQEEDLQDTINTSNNNKASAEGETIVGVIQEVTEVPTEAPKETVKTSTPATNQTNNKSNTPASTTPTTAAPSVLLSGGNSTTNDVTTLLNSIQIKDVYSGHIYTGNDLYNLQYAFRWLDTLEGKEHMSGLKVIADPYNAILGSNEGCIFDYDYIAEGLEIHIMYNDQPIENITVKAPTVMISESEAFNYLLK